MILSKNRISYGLYLLFLTLLFFAFHGYSYNTGDHIEHLIPVYHKLDQGLFNNDFYFRNYNLYPVSVRAFYVEVVYLFSLIWTVPVTLFILNFTCVLLMIHGIIKLSALLF